MWRSTAVRRPAKHEHATNQTLCEAVSRDDVSQLHIMINSTITRYVPTYCVNKRVLLTKERRKVGNQKLNSTDSVSKSLGGTWSWCRLQLS